MYAKMLTVVITDKVIDLKFCLHSCFQTQFNKYVLLF